MDSQRLKVNNTTGQIAVHQGNNKYKIYEPGQYKWNKDTGEYALPAGYGDQGQPMYKILNQTKYETKRTTAGRGGYVDTEIATPDVLRAPPIGVDYNKDGKYDVFVDRGPQEKGWRQKALGFADSIPFSDEAVAGVLALKHANQAGGVGKAYDIIQPIVEARYHEAERTDPQGYLMGQIGGGVGAMGLSKAGAVGLSKMLGTKATSAAPAIATAAGELAAPIVKQSGNLRRILSSAPVIGAGTGAVYGAGEGTGTERIGNALGGLALGAGLGAAPGAIKGAGNIIKSFIQPFTKSGQGQIVGKTLSQIAHDPMSLLNIERSAVPGVERTLGQSTKDYGIRAAENAMMSDSQIGGALAARAAENNAARIAYLENQAAMSGRPIEELGQIIKDRGRSAYEAARARTDEVYKAIDPDGSTSIDFRPIYDSVATDVNKKFAMRTGGTPEDLVSIMQRLRGTNNTDLASTDVMRQELYNIASQASRAGDNDKAAAATYIAKAIDNHLGNISSGEVAGALSAKQVEQLKLSRDLRKTQDKLFERGTMGDVLKRDRYGHDELDASKVIDHYLTSSPEKADQFFKAVGNDPEAVDALKRGIIEKLKTATGNINIAEEANLAPRKFNDALVKLSPVINKIFNETERTALTVIGRDLDNVAAGNAARGTGSNTQQNFAINHILSQLGGAKGADNAILQSVARGLGLGFIYKTPDQQIRERLGSVLLDPAEVQKLLKSGVKIPGVETPAIVPAVTGAVSGENQ